MPSSRGSSQPRDQICMAYTGRQVFYHEPPRKPLLCLLTMTGGLSSHSQVQGLQHRLLRATSRNPVSRISQVQTGTWHTVGPQTILAKWNGTTTLLWQRMRRHRVADKQIIYQLVKSKHIILLKTQSRKHTFCGRVLQIIHIQLYTFSQTLYACNQHTPKQSEYPQYPRGPHGHGPNAIDQFCLFFELCINGITQYVLLIVWLFLFNILCVVISSL